MLETIFALLVFGLVFGEIAVWSAGTMTALYAIFRPKKIAENRKAKRLLVVYFINAALCGLAGRFPEAANAVFDGAKSIFFSSAPYAEGGLALLIVIFVWVSPIIVIGFFVWLLIDVLASATASKIERRQKDRQSGKP